MDTDRRLTLPTDLLSDAKQFEDYAHASSLIVEVPTSYLQQTPENKSLSEVIAIQRLISLARKAIPIQIRWHRKVADIVFSGPNLYPLLAVVLCLDSTEHMLVMDDNSVVPVDVQPSRQLIYKYRLKTDFFSDTQILICADSRGHGRPKSLYSSKTSGLLARGDFESLVDRLLAGQAALNVSSSQAVTFSQNVATIVAELFENTDIHGRLGLNGVPIKANGIRGLVFKRVKVLRNERRRKAPQSYGIDPSVQGDAEKKEFDALEISVFDSGVGFYSSYAKLELTEATPLEQEWRVMHRCLERHYEDALPDTRSSHRGMGLYEVLRSLKYLEGMLEVRSGRAYGYRTFVPGEYKLQLEPHDSPDRPGMPKPVLLDVQKQFVTAPSANEALVGASIRVLIPLH